jgi:hypothetical protein
MPTGRYPGPAPHRRRRHARHPTKLVGKHLIPHRPARHSVNPEDLFGACGEDAEEDLVGETASVMSSCTGKPSADIDANQSKGFPMSQATIMNRSLFAAATAISAVGFLAVPAPAQADPPPPCDQYGFTGFIELIQSNGWRVSFTSTGPSAGGRADARGASGAQMHGNIRGGVSPRKLARSEVSLTISWDNGPTGDYFGLVNDNDGFAHGDTYDQADASSTAHWDSSAPLGCLIPAPPSPQQAPPPIDAVPKPLPGQVPPIQQAPPVIEQVPKPLPG